MNNNALFKKLDNLFIGLLSFLLFAGITIYFMSRNGIKLPFTLQPDTVSVTAIIIVSLTVVLVKYLPSKILNKHTSESDAVLYYKKITWIRLWVITLTDIAILLLFNVSMNYMLLLIYIILIALMFAYRPLEKNFKREITKNSRGLN